jgi:NAD-specific glutamate dehydrogenase
MPAASSTATWSRCPTTRSSRSAPGRAPDSRPELSTLLAWAKREIKEALLDSDVPDHEVLADALPSYFPRPLVTEFGDLLPDHPLRRQLVATVITNDLVDRMGVTFASSLAAERGVHRRARLAHARWLMDDLVPEELARLLACVRDLVIVPDVAIVTGTVDNRSYLEVADAFLRLGEALGIDELERIVERVDAPTGWARRQRRGLETDLRRLRRDAAAAALRRFPDDEVPQAVANLLELQAPRVVRARRLVDHVGRHEVPNLDALGVAARAISEVTRI